ncbi:MAG: polysaccharide deacetylase family protein [Candidatus Sumerlaeaceae bacterium]|nr:polysaccharide deacetylase family protein [Candidatus Sumerlaeaceae bacterium]
MAILTYHHIGDCPPGQQDHRGLWVTAASFRRQLEWLKTNGYVGIALDTIAAALTGEPPLPRRWVCITFDDGWLDNLTAALPELESAGFQATVFVISGKIRQGDPAHPWENFLSAEEIREMQGRGICIGSHTRTHPHLTKLSDAQVAEELVGSREELAEVIGMQPRWLCYPFGNFSPRIANIARDAGYAGATSTIRDNRVGPDQLFWMPRVMVMDDTTPQRLAYMLSPWYHYVHAWKNRRRWKSIK